MHKPKQIVTESGYKQVLKTVGSEMILCLESHMCRSTTKLLWPSKADIFFQLWNGRLYFSMQLQFCVSFQVKGNRDKLSSKLKEMSGTDAK